MSQQQFDYEVMRELAEVEDAQYYWEHRKDLMAEREEWLKDKTAQAEYLEFIQSQENSNEMV